MNGDNRENQQLDKTVDDMSAQQVQKFIQALDISIETDWENIGEFHYLIISV